MGRFGKSMTADMMTAYYSKGYNSEKMFSNLAISKSCDFHKHLNKYDVIHLDIQWCIEPAGGPEMYILESGNHDSGVAETNIPDTETTFDWLDYH